MPTENEQRIGKGVTGSGHGVIQDNVQTTVI
jgi:hypothetical protein